MTVRAGIRREAEALVNWKASLVSADDSLGSWSLANSTSLCKWTHITCNSAGHMTELLMQTSLNGTLDRFDFSAFPHLKSLTLFSNGLYGTIPAGIGNLTSLAQLYIFNNTSLRGAIPHSIGQLKHLSELYLSLLGLDSNLPEEIGNLTTLEELHLHSVTLTGSIPRTIGKLVKLRELSMQKNNLTGSIPLEIGNITQLNNLQLWYNYLQGQLPGTISNLASLQELVLTGNQLGGHIISEFGNSSLLDTVDIERNNFSGLFPSSICIGGRLRIVSARSNGFTGIHHHTFRNCTSVRYVDFTANNIVADIKDCVGEHPWQLSMMSLGQNHLYGRLLTDGGKVFICNSTYLTFLDLSNNLLDGGLPKCLWDMPSLGYMDLSSNSFSGVVPSWKTCEDNLICLRLANNHLKGTFPLGLRKCKNLISLDLGGNNFSGRIPSWISKSLPNLIVLRLSSNMFGGIIPHQILKFQQLHVLDLSKNNLSGPIPDNFTNFTGMVHNAEDIVSDNNLRFEIISGQTQIVWKGADHGFPILMVGIVGIDLSGNSLSQEIPKGLTTLLGLRYLNLSGNHLLGCIPEDIGNLVLLESLDLSLNRLSGEIPPSFAGLKSITALNLSSNNLSGLIPMSDQLRTLPDPSIYSNNPGLCGFPLEGCVDSPTSTQSGMSQAEDNREALWLYCFVAAGFIFGFWLYCGMFWFYSETWRCAFYQYVDNMQGKVTKKMYSCMSYFQAKVHG